MIEEVINKLKSTSKWIRFMKEEEFDITDEDHQKVLNDVKLMFDKQRNVADKEKYIEQIANYGYRKLYIKKHNKRARELREAEAEAEASGFYEMLEAGEKEAERYEEV